MKQCGKGSPAPFFRVGLKVEVGVTVLGDTQKSEMQPQVCLDAYLMVRDPLLSEALSGPWSPNLEAIASPDPDIGDT